MGGKIAEGGFGVDADKGYAGAGEEDVSSNVAQEVAGEMTKSEIRMTKEIRMTNDESDVITKVRRALGRREALREAPIPPELPQQIVRLVRSGIELAELFARRAEENKMHVVGVSGEELGAKLAEYLRGQGCKRVALAKSQFLERFSVLEG